MNAQRVAVLLIVCLVAACASREVLVPKSPAVPPDIDFAGSWLLDGNLADERRKLDAAARRTDGVNDRIVDPVMRDERNGQLSRPRRSRGGLVQVFLTNGRNLKITQTSGALFLSFDRAVVEEYRFGENRQIRVGPVLADRVSGWEGEDYVVETLDESGMKLTERYSLGVGGNTLYRTITLRGKNKQEETFEQRFQRLP